MEHRLGIVGRVVVVGKELEVLAGHFLQRALDFFYLFASVLQPLLLGPATPELMGPYMLRTFVSVRDPAMSSTQATVTFLICSLAGYTYVRAMAGATTPRGSAPHIPTSRVQTFSAR